MVTFRPMAAPDIDVLIELERQAMGRARPRDVWEREHAARAFDTLVADMDGVPVGFLCYHLAGDEASIDHIAVASSQRRMGIARALIDHLVKMLETSPVREIFLEVRRTNRPARALYAGVGFERVAVRSGYYRDPVEDALIFKIFL